MLKVKMNARNSVLSLTDFDLKKLERLNLQNNEVVIAFFKLKEVFSPQELITILGVSQFSYYQFNASVKKNNPLINKTYKRINDLVSFMSVMYDETNQS